MNKKAQTQNLETIIVIFIITVIIAISITIFYNLNEKSLDNLEIRYQQNKAYNLLSTLPLQPELQYTELGYDKQAIDRTKILNSKTNLKGFMTVKVIQLYPKTQEAICTSSNSQDCNTYIIYDRKPSKITNQEIVSTPVQLFNPLTKERAFANLEVTIYY